MLSWALIGCVAHSLSSPELNAERAALVVSVEGAAPPSHPNADRADGVFTVAERTEILHIRGVSVESIRQSLLIHINAVQGSDKRWFPGCVNAVGKARQKW